MKCTLFRNAGRFATLVALVGGLGPFGCSSFKGASTDGSVDGPHDGGAGGLGGAQATGAGGGIVAGSGGAGGRAAGGTNGASGGSGGNGGNGAATGGLGGAPLGGGAGGAAGRGGAATGGASGTGGQGGGASGTGGTGSGGAGMGGTPGTGGAVVGSGGSVASGGVVGSGGIVGTGGAIASGGVGGGSAGAGGASSGAVIARVVADRRSTCAITTAGALWCWGSNETGKLDGTTTAILFAPKAITDAGSVIDVGIGNNHMCVVRSDGSAYCRGSRVGGVLGDGGALTGTSATFVQVVGDVNGSVLPLTGLFAIASGTKTTCALGLPVYCWGDGTNGETGDPTVSGPQPTAVQVEKMTSGFLDPLRSYEAIRGGDDYMLGLKGTLLGNWGSVNQAAVGGALFGGPGYYALETSDRGRVFAAGTANACRVDLNSQLECTGTLGQGLLTNATSQFLFPTVTDIVDASLGNAFGCIVRGASRSLSCWGINAEGRLGTGSTNILYQDLASTGASDVQQLDSGDYHSCYVNSAGALFCWGRGNEGQIGNNDTQGVRVPTRIFVR